MRKITKNTVKAIIRKDGKIEVRMYPCKANIMLVSGYPILITSLDELERIDNEFTYYNCNSEMGYYPSFYIDN